MKNKNRCCLCGENDTNSDLGEGWTFELNEDIKISLNWETRRKDQHFICDSCMQLEINKYFEERKKTLCA